MHNFKKTPLFKLLTLIFRVNIINKNVYVWEVIMDCRPIDNAETNDNVNTQGDFGKVRGDTGRRNECVKERGRVQGTRGANDSLLFFFLLLVLIVCKSDCDIELNTLLWFFLLLVAIYNQYA